MCVWRMRSCSSACWARCVDCWERREREASRAERTEKVVSDLYPYRKDTKVDASNPSQHQCKTSEYVRRIRLNQSCKAPNNSPNLCGSTSLPIVYSTSNCRSF